VHDSRKQKRRGQIQLLRLCNVNLAETRQIEKRSGLTVLLGVSPLHYSSSKYQKIGRCLTLPRYGAFWGSPASLGDIPSRYGWENEIFPKFTYPDLSIPHSKVGVYSYRLSPDRSKRFRFVKTCLRLLTKMCMLFRSTFNPSFIYCVCTILRW
jgi:hypothetical protein